MLTAADVGLVTNVMTGINAPESLIQSITALLTSNSDGLVDTEVVPVGTGHFTKMVHNGIEYGLMQAYAEGYELLARSGLEIDATGALRAWRQGSVVRSWLLDLLVRALEQRPGLEGLAPVAQDSGEGRWTVQAAVEQAVPADVLTAALYTRFRSRQTHSFAEKLLSAMRRLPALTREAFDAHWRDRHVPLARAHHPGMWEYRQNAVQEALSPDAPDFDGIAVLGFPSAEDCRSRLYDSPEGEAAIAADLARFLDVSRSEATYTGEYVLRS